MIRERGSTSILTLTAAALPTPGDLAALHVRLLAAPRSLALFLQAAPQEGHRSNARATRIRIPGVYFPVIV